MASQLVDSLAADFDASQFSDDYQEQLRTLVEAKLEQGDALDTAATFGEQPDDGEQAEVIDLMDALQRSVEKSKKKKTASKSSASKAAPKKKARKGA
jgi:DNA end-binding protein Ku